MPTTTGNMLNDGLSTYTYDAENRISQPRVIREETGRSDGTGNSSRQSQIFLVSASTMLPAPRRRIRMSRPYRQPHRWQCFFCNLAVLTSLARNKDNQPADPRYT